MANQREASERYVVLGPQNEPIFCRNAAEARSLESRKRRAKPTDEEEEKKCAACGRPFDDEEPTEEEEVATRG